MSKKVLDIKALNANTAEIRLYGLIGLDEENSISAADFLNELNYYAQMYPNINVRINSEGGDVMEGIVMYNGMKQCTSNITTYIDGLAASMGLPVAMGGSKICMSKYAMIMLHKPSISICGDDVDIQNSIATYNNIQKSICDIIATKIGITSDEVAKKWMIHGKDIWLTAQECLDAKIIDEIYDNPAITSAPTNLSDRKTVINHYLNNLKNDDMKNIAKFVALFTAASITLSENPDENEVLNAVNKLSEKAKSLEATNKTLLEENTKFKEQVRAAHTAKITALVDGAITAKKITAAQKDAYTKLATADFDSTKSALDAMTAYSPLTGHVKDGAKADAEKANWKFSDWRQKDSTGLAAMKENDFESYKELYKNEYGTEPTK